MSKQHSIAEVLLIAGRKTTIVDEVLRGADVNTQVVYGDTSPRLPPVMTTSVMPNSLSTSSLL